MKLVFASNNAHKLEEVRAILTSFDIVSLREAGLEADIDENGDTLEDNSLIKARYVYDRLGLDCMADDTGLEIMALNGQPGVRTARWAGEPSDPAANRRKALDLLQGMTDRRAQFRTVITIIKQGVVSQVEGVVRGTIALSERGEGGFGYDSLFIPDGYSQTFAELPAGVKNTISHRARALAELKALLAQ